MADNVLSTWQPFLFDLRGKVWEVFPSETPLLSELSGYDAKAGATDHHSIRVYMDTVRRWTLGELTPSLPGGESGTSVRTRMLDAVGRLRAKHEQADPDSVIALVSHGGAIRLKTQLASPGRGPFSTPVHRSRPAART